MIFIDYISFLILVISTSYIWTRYINNELLRNNQNLRVFTHYMNYRSFFTILMIIAWWIIIYMGYMTYQKQWLFHIILLAISVYNISWLLRSIFQDLLYLEFYMYPLIIWLFIYNLFYPSDLGLDISAWSLVILNIVIFLFQSYIDNSFIKKEIWIYIDIDNCIDKPNGKDRIINYIHWYNPHYAISQIRYALEEKIREIQK